MKSGWIALVAALGMMAGLAAVDISKIGTWYEMTQPAFVASQMVHFAAVVTAFIGGKLLPNNPMQGGSRKSDPK